ncbi:MAG: LuxR family transcriptional regulator [Gammaproteobacteria bacterium]|nr:MAG: LuxR family transcriptional regulator [Gammaproteobacteria bacterium]
MLADKYRLGIDFNSLCQLPHKMHVYKTDANHRVLDMNPLQMQVSEKQSGIKDRNAIIGCVLHDLLSHQPQHLERILNENEQVLRTQQPLYSTSTILVPGESFIDLRNTKLPCYDAATQSFAVIGFSYYEREISLVLIEEFKLTPREIDCLDCLLMNKTAKETGLMLGISHRTVEDYLANAKHKLNCQNKAELVSKIKSLALIKRYF